MPALLGLLALLGGAVYWIYRMRDAAQSTHDLLDMAHDVRLAARRFGFRRRFDKHPADEIDDPNVAVAAIGCAFVELNGLPTREDQKSLTIALAKETRSSVKQAEDLVLLGHWLVGQCNGPQAAIERLSKGLFRSSQAEHFQPVMTVLKAVAPDDLSQKQTESLSDIQRGFRIK